MIQFVGWVGEYLMFYENTNIVDGFLVVVGDAHLGEAISISTVIVPEI